MLVRDAGEGIEVLMLRRNLASTWVGGVHLFPGGAVDEADASPRVAVRSNRDDEEASALLGLATGGLAFFVAAIRECFEEAGVLLARPVAGGTLRSQAEDLGEARRSLNAGRLSFEDLCEKEQLLLDAKALCYLSHWITPEGSARRYDTRFFVARAPEDQQAAHDEVEAIESRWVRPAVALGEAEAGTIELWLPTQKNLEDISRFATTSDLLQAAASREVTAVLPRIAAAPLGEQILLPGDEGYETGPKCGGEVAT